MKINISNLHLHITYLSQYIRNSAKYSLCMIFSNLQNISEMVLVWFPFYKSGNWGLETLWNQPQIPQLVHYLRISFSCNRDLNTLTQTNEGLHFSLIARSLKARIYSLGTSSGRSLSFFWLLNRCCNMVTPTLAKN